MSYRLPQGVKTAWVQALRSGEYEQGRDALRREGRHCCLGVLADCAGLLDEYGRFDGVSQFALLTRDDGYALPRRIQDDLGEMNDGGASFDEIADWIEANL